MPSRLPRRLVITEKNIAAQRIAQILSDGAAKQAGKGRGRSTVPVYQWTEGGLEIDVVGLRGHVINLDYPAQWNKRWKIGDLHELVAVDPVPMVRPEGEAIVKALKSLAKGATEVIVATDYDREGEAIGLEAVNLVREVNPDATVRRARFSAITPQEVHHAFGNLADMDVPLARSAEARQEVDLAWGAALTRYMSVATGRKGKEFLSVGRVQSPTLALVVDREEEIDKFVPEAYWQILATLGDGTEFKAWHDEDRFRALAVAQAAFERARQAQKATVTGIEEKEERRFPYAPLDTTQFLRYASRLGLGAAEAMRVAEDLYTSGFLSYPRTDNTVYPPSLDIKGIVQTLAGAPGELGGLGKKLLKDGLQAPSKGKKQTTDHPPIHPVSIPRPGELDGHALKVYEFVARHFLASLAGPSKERTVKATLELNREPFNASGRVIQEPGWRAYHPFGDFEGEPLPALQTGQKVDVRGVELLAKQTQPPKRYGQGALIGEMEKQGLGTKSTRHEIIQTLVDRGYVTGDPVVPTPLGRAMIGALRANAPVLTHPELTARLEVEMEEVAAGSRPKESVVKDSRQELLKIIQVLQTKVSEIGTAVRTEANTLGTCPKCGKRILLIRRGPHGRFAACEDRECGTTFNLPAAGTLEPHAEPCPHCRGPQIRHRMGRRRMSVLCLSRDCPSKAQSQAEKAMDLGPCPVCLKESRAGRLRIKRDRFRGQRFVACDAYPACRHTVSVPQEGVLDPDEAPCADCGSGVLRIERGGQPATVCVNSECTTRGAVEGALAHGTDLGACPDCGKPMLVRTARRGPNRGGQFAGCSGYPKCKKTFSLPEGVTAPAGKACPRCKAPMVLLGEAAKCLTADCDGTAAAEGVAG